MSRVVFFTFLGTNVYDPYVYTYEDKECKKTQYVQIAIYELLKEIHDEIEVVVFLTEAARRLNWQDGSRKKCVNGVETEVDNVGLETSFREFDPNVKLTEVSIPGPGDIEESWQLFDIILDHIEENDIVYFDMTHGFRSLPFISFIVLQYARKLKNISFGGLYYGEIINGSGRIVDYTDMTSLIEWAEGINQYVQTGNARIISEQVNRERRDLFQRNKLSDHETKYVSTLSKIANQMKSVTDAFETSRGVSIFHELERLQGLLSGFDETDVRYLKALVPLLDKVEQKLRTFQKERATSIKYVVDWCIEHGLIQQGYTFIIEYVISAVCDYAGLNKLKLNGRKIASSTLNFIAKDQPYDEWEGSEQFKNCCKELKEQLDSFPRHYFVTFGELNDYRNDINHAEKRKGSYNKETLIKKLPESSEIMYEFIAKLYQ